MAKFRAALPGVRIVFVGLPPVLRAAGAPESMAACRRMDELVAGVARGGKNLAFVDLLAAFPDEQGRSRAELFVEDGAHFSPAGYTVVAGLVREKL